MAQVRVKKTEEKPETKEILAASIVSLGQACERMKKNGGLNRRAIVVLLHDATKISKRDIEDILDAMTRLESWYCK